MTARGWRGIAIGAAIAARRPTYVWRTLPDFVIIGAQRAGTTSLFRYLTQHPRIRPPLRKEVHYFDLNFDRHVSWYRAHFPLGRGFVTGESSPYYMFHPDVPGRLSSALPGVRVIVLLRDPVARAYSHYQHERRKGRERLEFGEALRQEEDRLRAFRGGSRDPDAVTRHQRYSYVARGRYAQQLAGWLRHIPQERLHVVFTEELDRDPNGTLAGIFGFIGLGDFRADTGERSGVHRYQALAGAERTYLENALADDAAPLAALVGRPLPWSR